MNSRQRRITLFADSLALPRGSEWGNIAYEKTYPYLLETALRTKEDFKDFIFINRAQRFRTITDTWREYNDFVTLKNSDTVILHCGIVDCAPRVFSMEQRKLIEKLPWFFQRLIIKTVHTFRSAIIKTICREKVYTPLPDFIESLENTFKSARNAGINIIAVNIIVPSQTLDDRSPGYIKNATSYNRSLEATANAHNVPVIDLSNHIHQNGGHDELTTDGMHINEKGHAFMAEKLLELILR